MTYQGVVAGKWPGPASSSLDPRLPLVVHQLSGEVTQERKMCEVTWEQPAPEEREGK